MNHWVFERKFLKLENCSTIRTSVFLISHMKGLLRVVEFSKRKMKEVDAKHLLFLCGGGQQSNYSL